MGLLSFCSWYIDSWYSNEIYYWLYCLVVLNDLPLDSYDNIGEDTAVEQVRGKRTNQCAHEIGEGVVVNVTGKEFDGYGYDNQKDITHDSIQHQLVNQLQTSALTYFQAQDQHEVTKSCQHEDRTLSNFRHHFHRGASCDDWAPCCCYVCVVPWICCCHSTHLWNLWNQRLFGTFLYAWFNRSGTWKSHTRTQYKKTTSLKRKEQRSYENGKFEKGKGESQSRNMRFIQVCIRRPCWFIGKNKYGSYMVKCWKIVSKNRSKK